MASEPHKGFRPHVPSNQSVPATSSIAYEEGDLTPDITSKPCQHIQYAPIQREHDVDTIPISAGNEAELTRLALSISRSETFASMSRRKSYQSEQPTNELHRRDTLADIEFGDPVFDPSKPEFNFYKWARMWVRLMDEEGIKIRRVGFTFKNLNVSGSGPVVNIQKDVSSVLMAPLQARGCFNFAHKPEKKILRDFDGMVKSGEMLMVLGRPGSGCSTFLKTICGELTGLHIDKRSIAHYDGIPQDEMHKEFKGEVVYNQEVDKHFPHLTVGETLEFAAATRTPQKRVKNVSRRVFIKHISQVAMAVFGLSHTRNTKVGNDFVRGVSGGERKRVSIAEMALAGCSIACWDNSTRGLDAATALEFVKALRVGSNIHGMSHAVAIYQASQAIYDVFDKVIVLYEGREIYFGSTCVAKAYFETMGWYCPPRQTTSDFLTSVTNPQERKPRNGFERQVPRTPEEFEAYWRSSQEYAALQKDIDQLEVGFAVSSKVADEFKETRRARQAKHMRKKSPYIISIPMQIKVCTLRAYQRIWNDKASTLTTVIGQVIMALIVGSVYFGTPNTTDGFFSKGAVLFFAILLNALIAVSEINRLYEQRPIVEKQASYAFYHPFAEALSGIVADIPVKFVIAAAFNTILYFLAGLCPEPSQFFIFFLFVFVSTMTMSAIFRTVAASTKTITQALALAGVLVLAIVIYTGFTIPRPYMHPWFKWISWINPIAYAYEAVLVNEVHGRNFPCETLIPAYPNLSGPTFVCSVAGAVPGETFVSGDAWVQASYQYSYSNIWRNLGFLFAFLIFFLVVYLIVTELNSSTSSTAEVLVFRRGHALKTVQEADQEAAINCEGSISRQVGAAPKAAQDEELNTTPEQKDIFTWKDVVYDITIKGEPRRLLDHVSGWVTPGSLTALMGVSGAGKTTLLDVLAQRTSIGVITGDMFVNGKPLDASFQRKSGYVQQQDLHLQTTTVREALRFSAMLRQPKSVSKKEKYKFVEDVIRMLNMEDFSEAVVGTPGEGLNVEQRKLLTIGVELAAKPALLLFLDEPTSGLDSQSSWAIVAFLRKLADSGQAVLATIHQPSPILFQEFDRLLFLAKGGKTVYFGEIGRNSETLLNYFESHGSRHCDNAENPAEFMLEMVGAGASGKYTPDWHEIWNESEERKEMLRCLDQIYQERAKETVALENMKQDLAEFAMPLWSQLLYVTIRVFQQYWRTPSYVWGKILLGVTAALFIGFSFFQPDSSQQGLQNTIFSVFMMTTIFSSMVQQIMPRFVIQRSLYEVRERPSKTYSWKAFMIANIIVEIPYQILLGILVFSAYYYPVFGIQSPARQGLILIFSIQFFIFASTFAHLVISALPDTETAGKIATFLFSLMLTFNGVMQPPQALPGFWIFMYRVSPLTYIVGGVAADGLHERLVKCSGTELNVFDPPPGQTCGDYMAAYLSHAAGQLYNPTATSHCEYCPLSNADQYLASVAIIWSERWRNFGIVWSYIVFNIFMAMLLYYMFRVKRWSGASTKKGMSIFFSWIGVVGYWVRSILVRHPGKTPEGKEAISHQLY